MALRGGAHSVVWATQVLDDLVKEGLPSRAETTDAAMAQRAECVMLNKGPHIVEAIRFSRRHRQDEPPPEQETRCSALHSWPLDAIAIEPRPERRAGPGRLMPSCPARTIP